MQESTVHVNIVPGGMPVVLHISQYDVGLRQYTFTLYSTQGTWEYVSGASATLEATKPDNHAIVHNCTYNNDGTITYTVQEQLAAVVGRVWSKLVIRDTNSNVLGTIAIIWIVDPAGVTDSAIVSDSDISALQEFLAEFGTINAYKADLDSLRSLATGVNVASTKAGMTNHNIAYVYTGSESGMVTYNWYWYNGSDWVSGGAWEASVATDTTLTTSGKAADAKATGDAIAELKSEIEQVVTTNVLLYKPYLAKYVTTTQRYVYDSFLVTGIKAGATYAVVCDSYESSVNPTPVCSIRWQNSSGTQISSKDVAISNNVQTAVAPANATQVEIRIFYVTSNYPSANTNVIIYGFKFSEGTSITYGVKTDLFPDFKVDIFKNRWEMGGLAGTTPNFAYTDRLLVYKFDSPFDTSVYIDFDDTAFSLNVTKEHRCTGATSTQSITTKGTTLSLDNSYYYHFVYIKTSGNASLSDANSIHVYKLIPYSDATLGESVNDIYKTNNSVSVHDSIIPIIHGGTLNYPQNVLELYKLAYKNGIRFWECDVRPCADDYVLCHDNDIYNHALTSGGATVAQNTVLISNTALATLQTYKFGCIVNDTSSGTVDGFTNATIPTFAQFIKQAKRCRAIPIIEIKFTPTQTDVNNLMDIVMMNGMQDNVFWMSESVSYLTMVQTAYANANVIYGETNTTSGISDATITSLSALKTDANIVIASIYMNTISDTMIEKCAAQNIRTGVWTIVGNRKGTIPMFLERGITSYIMNDVEAYKSFNQN